MEESYRGNLLRSFKKTLEDGYFSFVLVDAVHDKIKQFVEMYSSAKSKGFEVRKAASALGGGWRLRDETY